MTGANPTMALTRYDAAKQALAEVYRIDEVKDIADKAAAMQLYAKQAKDGDLIAHATEIRKRAERRLGELMAEVPKAKPPNPKRRVAKRPDDPPTLADQGVDKHLADRARKAAAMPEDKFEAQVAQAVKVAVAATEGDREVIKAARVEQQAKKRAQRQERERELGAKIVALPDKKYGVIYADPPWKFEVYNDETGGAALPDNHYATLDLEAIKALPIPAAGDCVLFLWATVPMLPQALEVMEAWGFTYKSLITWIKDRDGTGYWTRNRVELLLIGMRGDVPAPAQGDQPSQAIEAPRGRHSEKPAAFAEMIEKLYPNTPKIELFARERRDGWDVWGNEAPAPTTVSQKAEADNAVPADASGEAMKAKMATLDQAADAPAVSPDAALDVRTFRSGVLAVVTGKRRSKSEPDAA